MTTIGTGTIAGVMTSDHAGQALSRPHAIPRDSGYHHISYSSRSYNHTGYAQTSSCGDRCWLCLYRLSLLYQCRSYNSRYLRMCYYSQNWWSMTTHDLSCIPQPCYLEFTIILMRDNVNFS